MHADIWRKLFDELDLWQQSGRQARLWLRDDDAITPSPALDRLIGLANEFSAPVLLAVIPKGATPELVQRILREPLMLPTQHGFSHRNHAPKGEKPQELGLHRGLAAVMADIAHGRQRLLAMFGKALRPVLVPPWNRIDPALLPHLSAIGLAAVSAFSRPEKEATTASRLNCHVDIIDWSVTRSGHPLPKQVDKLVAALGRARADGFAPVGILAHHLVHGDNAWGFLEGLGAAVARHPAAGWISADELLVRESLAA